MRVIFLILAFATGIGFIAYIVAWIAMPKEYAPPTPGLANVGGRSVAL
jgi:phage shock protein PspC (stress-responsive transcriptional regulator)